MLKNIVLKPLGFIKRRKKLSIIGILIIAIVLSSLLFRGEDILAKDTTVASLGDVNQEVSVTGRVKSAQAVELAFDRSGRVSFVSVSAGDRIGAGQVLARLDSSESLAQRQIELANIAASKQRLEQVTVAGSQTSGESTAIDVLSKSIKTAIDAMVDYSDIQYTYFNSNTSENNHLADSKGQVLKAIYGQDGLGRSSPWYFTTLNSGLRARMAEAENQNSLVSSDELINEVRETLLLTKNSLELIYAQMTGAVSVTSGEKTSIRADLDLVISQLSSLTSQNKNIVSSNYDVEIARIQLQQAEAQLALLDAQTAKNSLTAPFAGIV